MTEEIPYKLVSVTWYDAAAESGWGKPEAISGPHNCVSVGWLVRDETDWICLAGTIGGGEANQTISIPRPWIGEMKEMA